MTKPLTARHDLTIWRNDDYYEYPIRVPGLDLTGVALAMQIRFAGDAPGPALVSLGTVTQEAEGIWFRGVTVENGIEVSRLVIRMNRASIQSLGYDGKLGETAQREYALLFGGRTRLVGSVFLPAHAYGSDTAPAKRGPITGMAQRSAAPDAGITLTIDKDGGATVEIDGADLVSRSVLRTEDAAERTDEARDTVQGIASTSYQSVPTYAAREAIPLDKRGNGMRVQVMEGTPRVFEWRTDLFMPGGWTGLYTQAEVKNLGIDFTGQLPVANVEGLSDVQDAVDDIAAIRITGFRATALSSVGGKVQIDAKFFGLQPDRIVLSWRGYSVPVKSLPFTPPDQAAVKDFAVSGNSIDDATDEPKWHTILAARRAVADWFSARYSSDGRQTFRAGIDELIFTFAGNVLPAGGTAKAIASINGNSPIDPNTGYAFLNTGADYLTTGVSMPGVVIDLKTGEARHGVASIPNAASAVYSFVQDAGLPAIALSGPVRFVPDIAAEFARCDNFCGVGNNLFYSGVPNAYGDYTNPALYEVVDKFAAAAQGQRFILRDVLPAGEWPADGSPNVIDGVDYKTHMFAATEIWNARNEERHPGSRPRSLPTAGFPNGRTLLKFMQDHSDGSAADNAAIAQGKIPVSLWTDGPHPNAAGHVVIADFYEEAMQTQALAPSLPIGTTVTLTATATNPRTGETIRSLASVVVQPGDLAALIDPLQGAIEGVVTNSEYRPTLASAIADFAVGTFFVSDDRDGVSLHPGEKRRYQVIAAAPYWHDEGRFVDKRDVGLSQADDTPDSEKPMSRLQRLALNDTAGSILAYTAAGLDRKISFDEEQALSDDEKATARSNVGAVDKTDVDNAFVDELLLNHRGMTWAQAKLADLSRAQTIVISDRGRCSFARWTAPLGNLDPYQENFSWLTSADGSSFYLPYNNVTPFEAFGAIGNYNYDTGKGTDNTAALQAAFNWARPRGGSLTAQAGAKYLTGSLYLHYDAIKNPGAVQEPADTSKSDGSWRPGRLSLIGQGGGIATGSLEAPGCALIHKPNQTDPLLSCIGSFSIAKPSAMGGQLSILRLNLVGGNTTPAVLYLEAVQGQVSLWDFTVKGTNKNGHGVVCKTTWEKWVCNLLVRGAAAGLGPNDPGYNPYAPLATGIGWLETDNGSGGQVNMSTWTNVNVYRWGTLWFIGRTNGSDGTFGPLVFIGCQGSYSDYHGVVLGGGVLDLETFGFQIEQTRLNGLLIDSQGASDIPRSINWRGYFTQCGKIEDGSPQSFATHVVDAENVTLHKNTYRAVRGGIIFDRSKVKNLAIVRPYCRDVSAWGKTDGTFIDAYGDLTNFACISLERPRLVNGTKTIIGPLAQEAFDREAVGEVKTDSTDSATPSLSMGFATGNAATKLLVLNKPTRTLITDFVDGKAFQSLQLPFANPNSEIASNGSIYLAGESFVPADSRATLTLRRDPSNSYWAEVAGARYVGEERVLSMSAVPVVLTGSTVKKTFAGFGLRGGYLGIDGRIELDLIFSCTNNANVKTLRVEYGGTTFFAAALTTVASGRAQPAFQNRGNAKSQLSASGSNLGVGTNSSEILTMSIDSSQFQQILITGQLANAADTLTLEGYRIRGVRGHSI